MPAKLDFGGEVDGGAKHGMEGVRPAASWEHVGNMFLRGRTDGKLANSVFANTYAAAARRKIEIWRRREGVEPSAPRQAGQPVLKTGPATGPVPSPDS